jgi:hypothetical protein
MGNMMLNHDWLVVSTPLKKMSVGMIIANVLENKIHVPNHQSDEKPLSINLKIWDL